MNTAKILSSANIPLYPLSFKVVILSLKIPITIKFLTTPPQVRTSCLLPLPLPPTSLLSTHILPPPYLPVPNFAPIYPIPPPPTCITTTPTSCTCALGYHQTYVMYWPRKLCFSSFSPFSGLMEDAGMIRLRIKSSCTTSPTYPEIMWP